MTTAILERLDPAILAFTDNPEKAKKLPLSERYSDKRSNPNFDNQLSKTYQFVPGSPKF